MLLDISNKEQGGISFMGRMNLFILTRILFYKNFLEQMDIFILMQKE
jgi:hypothetical protein